MKRPGKKNALFGQTMIYSIRVQNRSNSFVPC
ncbi:hypothetical protein GQA12_26295 [Paenibacillus alvei]|nr:hypothetical protein [Paenibacillus alvei]